MSLSDEKKVSVQTRLMCVRVDEEYKLYARHDKPSDYLDTDRQSVVPQKQ